MDNLRSYNNIFGWGEARRTEAEAELVQAQAYASLANKPAQKMNPLIFIIPVAGLLTLGVIFIVASKRSKR